MALTKAHVRTRLQKAREFLAQPGKWHCNSLYNVKDGKLVGACAIGALYAVDPKAKFEADGPDYGLFRGCSEALIEECQDILDEVAQQMHAKDLVHVNDFVAKPYHDKRYILRVYDRAIASLS